jgi:alpha-galactosidase
MQTLFRIGCIGLSLCIGVRGQMTARLHTSDTELTLQAGATSPVVSTLSVPGQAPWVNRASENLIAFVEVSGRQTPCKWNFNRDASRVDDQHVEFVYDSTSPHLRLTWEWRVRQDYGPIEHQIRIQNLESQEIWMPMQDSLALELQIDPRSSMRHMYIEKGADSPSPIGTHQVPLSNGYDWSGLSSTYGDLGREPREIIPWSLVQRDDASQTGWYAGIEFSGRTRIHVTRDKDSLKAAFGLNPDPAPFKTRLEPKELFDSPIVFLGGFEGGADGAGNVLRRWVRATLGSPDTWKDPNYPWVVNNSWGGGMNINEEVAVRMIRDAAELGVDMFHIDAGWFREVGDWYANPKKFPRGLAVIADEAHRRGLKFGLWVDWAQAGLSTETGSLNVRDPKVRDWMVTDLPADWNPEPFKGQTIDLGIPEAKQWAQREVERIVTDYHLDMLEHDGYLVAHGCDRSDHPHAAPDPLNKCIYKSSGFYWVDSSNSTDVSYHAVRAYYEIYSKLRHDHPGLRFEICNDGGRMVDFGSAAHGDYFSITDTYDPVSNRRAFYDTSYVLPAAMLESYVEKWPVPHIENFRYMLRSGMMGWFTIMLDTNAWTTEQHEAAKQEVDLYKKELRPLIRDADLYHVSARPDGIQWDGIEYWDPKSLRGALYAFHGSIKTEKKHSFVWKGLRSTARYQLVFHDHSSPDRVVTGEELMSRGITVDLPSSNSSEIVFIREIQ